MNNKEIKIIETKMDDREGILFKKWIKLSNGVEGKLIIINNKETHYIIRSNSDVINILTGRILKPHIGKFCPYKTVNIQLGKRGNYKTVTVHRLLGFGYIPNINNKPIINHKDGNKLNLKLDNLEWSTYSENNIHAYEKGLKTPSVKKSEECNFTTHTKEDVVKVCELLQTGKRMKEIALEYPNFGYDFIRKIRAGLTWKSVSINYTFPFVDRYSSVFSKDELDRMNYLFSKSYSVKKVIEEMNWEYDEQIKSRVKYYKRKFKKNHREDQVKPL